MTSHASDNVTRLPDRRATDRGLGGEVVSMKERLAKGDERMGRIEKSIEENTKATSEILEILNMGRSFFRVLGYVGNGIKWISSVLVAAGAIWYVFTHGPQK